MQKENKIIIPTELIEHQIFLMREQKVMLDRDLAKLYGVTTGNLNLAVRRNKDRFPEDFMFRLTVEETKSLVLQIARPKGRGGSQIPPYAFTEQGVAMLSSILKSKRAIHVNIAIMRAFVRLREIMVTHKDLARQIETLERKYNKHDEAIQSIFQAIKQLLTPPKTPKRQIGFKHLI